MELREFIDHIKHKSLKITIYSNLLKPILWFEGTIGEYSTSVVKSEINNRDVQLVVPNHDGSLDIRIADQYNDYKTSPITPKRKF